MNRRLATVSIALIVLLTVLLIFADFQALWVGSQGNPALTAHLVSPRKQSPTEEQISGLSFERQNVYFFCLGFESNCGFLCFWDYKCIWRATVNSTYRAVCWEREIQTKPLQFSENAIREKILNSPCRMHERKQRVWQVLSVYDQMVDLSFNIVYHLALGIDHVLVYDENTTGMKEMLSPFIKLGVVTYIPVSERRSQRLSYRDAHKRGNGFADWMFFCDVDEFLYDFEHRCVHDILSTVPNDASVLSINWMEILPSLASGGREPGHTYFSRNQFSSFGSLYIMVKSFCQPKHTENARVHFCEPLPPYIQVNSNLQNFSGYSIMTENPTLVLVHYRGGDFYEFLRKRIRGTGNPREHHNRTLFQFVDETVLTYYTNESRKYYYHSFTPYRDLLLPGFEVYSRAYHQLYQELFVR